MRRTLIGAFVAAACAAALAFLAGALFLAEPGTILTNRTVGAGLRHFGARWSPRWNSLMFSAVALGPRRHRYALRATGLCLEDRGGAFSGCFSELDVSVVASYSRRGIALERVERLVATADRARLDLRRLPSAGAPAASGFGAPWAGPLDSARVTLTRLAAVSSAAAVSGDLRLAFTPGTVRPLAVDSDLLVRRPSGVTRLKTRFAAAATLAPDGSPASLDFAGQAALGAGRRLHAAFRVRRRAAGYVATGGAEVDASTGPVSSLRLTDCAGSSPGPFTAAAAAGALSCRYELRASDAAAKAFGGIRSVRGGVALNGRLAGGAYSAELKADVEPVKAWYTLSAAAELRVSGRLGRPWRTASVTHDVRAAVEIPRFADLVAFLRRTPYAVPAPIHVLDGPLSFSLRARGDPRADRQAAGYAYASALSRGRQRLVLKGVGEFTVDDVRSPGRSFAHAGELILEDVALEAPRLELGPPPKVFLDRRIAMDDAPPAANKTAAAGRVRGFPPARGFLTVRTGKPLIVYSNLAKDPIPATLDLVLAFPPASVAGRVGVRSFGVELFRRRATVDHLNVVLSSGSAIGTVDGLIVYKTPAVTIDIEIRGTTAKPRIELTSVPPLKREDILALLIFGKDPAELDPEQVASVGNTETALESQAFGLGSLYLFGTTSVERVGYDSATRTASVKVRLPGGADLAFGSDFDQNRKASLRKLLAPHWALESDVTGQGSQGPVEATTFLEWFNRY